MVLLFLVMLLVTILLVLGFDFDWTASSLLSGCSFLDSLVLVLEEVLVVGQVICQVVMGKGW
jgi:hypothetical protein